MTAHYGQLMARKQKNRLLRKVSGLIAIAIGIAYLTLASMSAQPGATGVREGILSLAPLIPWLGFIATSIAIQLGARGGPQLVRLAILIVLKIVICLGTLAYIVTPVQPAATQTPAQGESTLFTWVTFSWRPMLTGEQS